MLPSAASKSKPKPLSKRTPSKRTPAKATLSERTAPKRTPSKATVSEQPLFERPQPERSLSERPLFEQPQTETLPSERTPSGLVERRGERPMVEFHNVHFGYDEGVPVVSGVSFTVSRGESLVILGGSGSGKSTLLRLLMGFYRVDGGSIHFEGRDVMAQKGQALFALRRRMGMVFQEGALFDSLTVGENVGYYLLEHGMDNPRDLPEVERRVRETLRLVGLEHCIDKMPGELSGGMRRRVSAARTIIYSPDLILYDEPTTGLDPASCENFCGVMNDIKREKKVASILVTHNLEDAWAVGDHFLLLRDGRSLWQGPTAGLRAMPEDTLMKFFRGEPI
ncbi:MAG TPA: ATP-binding cassette domain-containing protein [bacterium]|nr:ATP-binding cassette domain-containing protein [bacterium]